MNSFSLFWKTSNLSVRLIVILSAVFLLYHLVEIIADISGHPEVSFIVFNNIGLSANLSELLYKPWTLFTHFFMHSGVLHLAFNLLMLYFTFRLFTQYFDDKDFFSVYFLSGLSGAFFYLAAFNLVPGLASQSSIAVGASACIYGTLAAICAYKPNERVRLYGIFEISLLTLLFIVVLLNVVNYRSNPGGYWGHFGGLLFGITFSYFRKKFVYIHRPLFPVYDLLYNVKTKRSKLKVVHKTAKQAPKPAKSNDEQLNEILDKISRSGYESLSKDEKQRLFDLSNKS